MTCVSCCSEPCARIAIGFLVLIAYTASGAGLPPCCPGPACPATAVRLIVPFSAGGPTDAVARILSERLATTTGRPFVVDNRPGADGLLAAEVAARAQPEHTLFVANSQVALNIAIQPKQSIDLSRDLTPVAVLGTMPSVLVVHPSVPSRSVEALVEIAKTTPGKIMFATMAPASQSSLATFLFEQQIGAKLMHVPYKATGAALAAVATGEVTGGIFPLAANLVSEIRAGRLVPLAVISQERSRLLPDVPTMKEAASLDISADFWIGVFASGKTPVECRQSINKTIQEAMNEPQVRATLANFGYVRGDYSAAAAGEFIRAQTNKWAAVAKQASVTLR